MTAIECPEHNLILYAGSIVRLGRFESIEWLVSYGWYTWGGNRPVCGWYLVQCDAPSNLKPLQGPDLDDIYVIEAPPPPPPPPAPGPHIDEVEKDRYDRAFITLYNYTDLETLMDNDLHDGKLVRINHDIEGGVGYYVWNANDACWDVVTFDGSVAAIDTSTIDDIVDDTATSLDPTKFLNETGLDYYTRRIGTLSGLADCRTTAEWAQQTSYLSVKGALYVYTDHHVDEYGRNVPAIKVGDGTSYVIDLPFSSEMFDTHIVDDAVHVSAEDREAWDSNVSVSISPSDPKNLIFSIRRT